MKKKSRVYHKESFFKKLEKPDSQLQFFLSQKTLSGRINQAVKIATTDYMQLKSKYYELERKNN